MSIRKCAAALIAVPVLVLASACGGGDEKTKDEGIASVPETPTAEKSKDGSKAGPDADQGKKSSATRGKGAFYDAQMKYVQCMRTDGNAKDFPDPKLSGYLDNTKISEVVERTKDTEIFKGGKDGVCVKQLTDAMKLEPERDAQKEYESMLAHAKCMRDNGVSKFTNPTMSGGNVLPGGDPNPASPQIDSGSPGYKQAVTACKDKLLDGLDGMQ